MTNVSEVINTPREISLGGRSLKVRQLKIRELFGYFEQKIRDKKLAEAQEMANLMEGEAKNTFLISVWKSLPTGSELTNQALEELSTVDGIVDMVYLAAKDFQDISVNELKDLIDVKSIEELDGVLSWISGVEALEEKDAVEGEDKKK